MQNVCVRTARSFRANELLGRLAWAGSCMMDVGTKAELTINYREFDVNKIVNLFHVQNHLLLTATLALVRASHWPRFS